MKRIIRRRPSPALVIACVALFASLGGVSYAVATGSIDSREIKNQTLRSHDIGEGGVGTSEARNQSLSNKDIKNGDLEAGTLGGKSAAQLDTRWALVNEQGQIERQSGGFKTVNCFQFNANCYIDAGEDVRDNGIHAQIAIQNNDTVADPTRLSGETGTAPCGATSVTCAPPGTETNNILVVAPRESDGTATTAGNRFRFYVFVTGSPGA